MDFEIAKFPLFVQILGFVATGCTLAAFTQHSDTRFRGWATLGSVFWSIHFALLGALTAAATMLVIGSRQGASHWISRWPTARKHAAAWVYFIVFSSIAVWTWQGWHSLLPWFMAVNGTYGYFFLSGARMRKQMLLSDAAGLVNGFAVNSWGGVVGSLAYLAINLRTVRQLQLSTFKPKT
jgi:hypothetical protein